MTIVNADPLYFEVVFVLFPALEQIVAQHTTVSPLDADPREVYAAVADKPSDRLVALLYGHGIGESMGESEVILDELLALLADGRRPRDGSYLLPDRSAS